MRRKRKKKDGEKRRARESEKDDFKFNLIKINFILELIIVLISIPMSHQVN